MRGNAIKILVKNVRMYGESAMMFNKQLNEIDKILKKKEGNSMYVKITEGNPDRWYKNSKGGIFDVYKSEDGYRLNCNAAAHIEKNDCKPFTFDSLDSLDQRSTILERLDKLEKLEKRFDKLAGLVDMESIEEIFVRFDKQRLFVEQVNNIVGNNKVGLKKINERLHTVELKYTNIETTTKVLRGLYEALEEKMEERLQKLVGTGITLQTKGAKWAPLIPKDAVIYFSGQDFIKDNQEYTLIDVCNKLYLLECSIGKVSLSCAPSADKGIRKDVFNQCFGSGYEPV